MARQRFKCSKCDRSFSMAAHLARHMNSTHASPQKKAAAKRKRKAKRPKVAKKVKKAKRTKKAKRKAAGRPKGAGARLGLRNMTLEQLINVIAAARAEARRKIIAFQKAMK